MAIVVVVCGEMYGKIEKLLDWNKNWCGSPSPSHICSQNLEVWRRRRIKSPSEGPWFHLWGLMVKIILVC